MKLTAGIALQNGKYVLDQPLGQSKLGITFQATQAHLKQQVVLKTINRQPDADIAHLKQPFLERARRFATCHHPGLVRTLDLFEEDGLPFIVMDYVSGQSLAELVKSRGLLPEAQALQYVRQVGSALSTLHRGGLVHQEVTPQNLIRPKGADFVVLVGFKLLHSVTPGVKEPFDVSGAEGYTPIEHYSSAQSTAASDIYALSATLYFLLTGQNPIAAPLRDQTPLTAPRQLQPTISSTVEAAILRGMEVHPQSRPQSIAAWFSLLSDSNSGSDNPIALNPELMNGAARATTAIEQPQMVNSNGSTPVHPSQPHPSQPHPSQQATQAAAPPAVKPLSNPVASRKKRFPKVLLMAATVALAVGLGIGLVFRFSAASGVGPKLFKTKQPFPPIEGWPGVSEPITAPIVPLPPEPSVRNQIAPDPLPVTREPLPELPSPVPEPIAEPTAEVSPSPEPSPTEPVTPTTEPEPLLPPVNSAPALAPPAAPPSPEPAPSTQPDGAL